MPILKRRRLPGKTPLPVSMTDVARLAGVSGMTVSRVMRREDSVLPATAAAVRAAIAELGYVPNLAAATLAHNRSRAIGVVVPTLAGAIFADAVQGLTEVLGQAGYTVILGCDNYIPALHHNVVASLLGRRVEALVLHSSDQLPPTADLLRNSQVPVLQFWELAQNPFDLTVGINQRLAGYHLTRHLIGRGARRIAFVVESQHSYRRMLDRLEGYGAAIGEAGLETLVTTIPYAADIEGGARLVAEFQETRTMPDALLLHNDFSAAGALFEAQRQGLDIGQELRIATISYTSLTALTNPGITSLSVDCRTMGRRSASALLARLAGEEMPEKSVDLGFSIIQRGTS